MILAKKLFPLPELFAQLRHWYDGCNTDGFPAKLAHFPLSIGPIGPILNRVQATIYVLSGSGEYSL